jgi:hypothetical protein
LEGCPGAFVNVLALAEDDKEFIKIVSAEAGELGLKVDEIDWMEPLEDRLAKFEIEQYLLEFAEEIREEGGGSRFGIFHAWEDNEED